LKINVLITGKLRNSIEFKQQTIRWLKEDQNNTISKIIYVTWSTEHTREIDEFANQHNKFQIIKIKQKFSYLRPNSTFKLQKALFDHGLQEFENSDLIFKTRTDVHTNFKYLQYLSRQKALISGCKIWVPNYSPEAPGMFADISFCGLKSQLLLLYKPSGLHLSSRSSNGMKTHLDTWSGYINQKIPRQIDFINWLGKFFSIKESIVFYLISKDRLKGQYKKILWEVRHISLIRHSEYKFLLELYKKDVSEIFLIGSKSKSFGSVYLRRQGKHFHSKESLYRKNTGNYVTEYMISDGKERNFGVLIKSINRDVVSDNIKRLFSLKARSLKGSLYIFTQIRFFGRPEINYFRAIINLALRKTIHTLLGYNKL
jgi:hypothetical protein